MSISFYLWHCSLINIVLYHVHVHCCSIKMVSKAFQLHCVHKLITFYSEAFFSLCFNTFKCTLMISYWYQFSVCKLFGGVFNAMFLILCWNIVDWNINNGWRLSTRYKLELVRWTCQSSCMKLNSRNSCIKLE